MLQFEDNIVDSLEVLLPFLGLLYTGSQCRKAGTAAAC